MTRNFSVSAFYRDRELNTRTTISSVGQLWELIVEEQDATEATETTFRNLTASQLLFRGQSTESHGLSTSLHRALRADVGPDLTEHQLFEAEERIRVRADALGIGLRLSAIQVQQVLQHHHAPTRLLDVSRTPMESLFFATENKDLTDGRLFLINVERNPVIELDDSTADLPWAKYIRGRTRADAKWTKSVLVIEGHSLDTRMIAQNGVFLVGGIQRKYSNRNILFEGSFLDREDLQAVSMLTIGFPKKERATMGDGWPAYAWTVRIPGAWKKELRRRLETERGISHRTIYPAYESLKWETEAAVRV